MKRYFYYLVFVHMLVNGIGHTPRQLIENRFHGSVLAIFIAPFIGLFFMYIFSKALSKFPKAGLPEILHQSLPRWLASILLIHFSIAWLFAALDRLVSFSFIIKRFVNPDMPIIVIQIGIIFVVGMGALLKTEKILYLLEMLLVINVLFIIFIFFKAYTNPLLSWKDIMAAGTFIKEPPNLISLSAATYIFSGYINMVVFNRVCHNVLTWKKNLFLGILGFVNLCTILFIPIGYHGIDVVDDFTYPWVSTADALRMEFGFIERAVFLYIFIYISISIGSVIVLWHTISELLKGLFKISKKKPNIQKKLSVVFICLFGILTIVSGQMVDEIFLYKTSTYWYNIRMISEYLLVFLVYILARRKKA
ncbi:spore germination protein [Caldibacillus lycopersici]|uniref:Spore germination protein n=1 Tax=Perspicuibacillus lycopersici TaxID=1325689 RepID=A0AAE3ISC5_9BACI|nr:spore germination protein [Perspicuibacillus lycopersici]MCU9613522.1 spore germination protein [Perspicuibacillus lycopersici]